MRPYRAKRHPAAPRLSRKLAALPPPAPMGAPTGCDWARQESWATTALVEVRQATAFFRETADLLRSLRRELEERNHA